MYSEVKGNLLADNADALVNTVNTVGVMGKGIALQFKRAYPDMFEVYRRDAKAGRITPGRMHVWETGTLSGPRYIINFPTKRHWKNPSRLDDIEAGLGDLARLVPELEITSIAVPPLGCGNGGLAWHVVEPLIRDALEPLSDRVDVRVYVPAGAPPAREMINRTTPPKLTPARAALLTLMSAYHAVSFEWPGLIGTQKLAYFLQEAGEPMRLTFNKAPYGPYADELRKSLRDMEGHWIVGFGDGSASPLDADVLEVTPQAQQALAEPVRSTPETHQRTHRVLSLIEGFEGTYDLELLASVHWAATRQGAENPDDAVAAIREWTLRKADLFGTRDVSIAWDALERGGWLHPVAAG